MRESDEVWWRGRRREEGEPSQDELNKFLGFSQIFKMIVESVSSSSCRPHRKQNFALKIISEMPL